MNDCVQILSLCFVVAMSIMTYSKYRCKNPNFIDPLTNGSSLCSFCDGWSISHFMFYGLLGFLYPTRMKLIMSLGVGWEMFEWAVSHTDVKILNVFRGVSQCKITSGEGEGEGGGGDARPDTIDEHWFYAKPTDIMMNFMGFYLSRRYFHG